MRTNLLGSLLATQAAMQAFDKGGNAIDAAIAAQDPSSLEDLQGISGIGAKKLEAYGQEVLRVVAGVH